MEAPLLVIGKHQSNDVLAATPARVLHGLIALIAGGAMTAFLWSVCALLGGAAGALYSVLIEELTITFLDPRDYSWLVALVFVPCAIVAYRYVRRWARARADRIELRSDSVRYVPRIQVFRRRRPAMVPLTSIGNIEFLRPDWIVVDFGRDTTAVAQRAAVRVSAPTAEDDLESLERHMDEYSGDTLYSITDAGVASYSRAWTLEELFPESSVVQQAFFGLAPEEDGRHILETPAFVARVDVSHRAMELDAGGRRIVVEDGAMRDWRGLVLGVVERNPFRVRITLGTKQVIELQNDDRAVVLDDQRIGSTITRSGQMELRLDRPILPSLAAMILLVRRRHDA